MSVLGSYRGDARTCPLCRRPYVAGANARRRRSLDHILPKSRGGRDDSPADRFRNTRPMCQECNGALSSCNHCIGTLACVRAVATGATTVQDVARQWRVFTWRRAA